MTAWVIAAIGMAYAFACGDMIVRGEWPLAAVLGGCSLAQCGLYALAKTATV